MRKFKEARSSKLAVGIFRKNLYEPIQELTEIDKLKAAVTKIVQYFYSSATPTSGNEFDNPEIGKLVRNFLVPAVHVLFAHELKPSIFSAKSYWQWIEACSLSSDGSYMSILQINH